MRPPEAVVQRCSVRKLFLVVLPVTLLKKDSDSGVFLQNKCWLPLGLIKLRNILVVDSPMKTSLFKKMLHKINLGKMSWDKIFSSGVSLLLKKRRKLFYTLDKFRWIHFSPWISKFLVSFVKHMQTETATQRCPQEKML